MLHVWTRGEPSSARPTVAVVDDDDDFRRAALRLLKRFDAVGVGLVTTSSALRWVATARAAMVIVDDDRLRAIVALARTMDEPPVIVATMPFASQPCVDGACAVIDKPIDTDQFARVLRRFIA